MVTHRLAPGIEITVLVDGQPLKEYDCENDHGRKSNCFTPEVLAHQDERMVTKYVESVTGKNFSIKLKVNLAPELDCPTLGFSVFVNGKWITSPLLKKKWLRGRRND